MKKVENLIKAVEADIEAALTPELKQEAIEAGKAYALKFLSMVEQFLANLALEFISSKIKAA